MHLNNLDKISLAAKYVFFLSAELLWISIWNYLNVLTVSYDEVKQKVITQANDYHRVKAYTP